MEITLHIPDERAQLLGRAGDIERRALEAFDDPMTPVAVRQWIAAPPGWLSSCLLQQGTDPALASLDVGERAAIALAPAIKAFC
jgi:hypothetical protein